MRKSLYLIAVLAFLLVPLAAQVPPSGHGGARNGVAFWVGASLSVFNSDYGSCNGPPFFCSENVLGVAPYLDTNFFLGGKIGLEGEARLLLFHGPNTLVQNSYLAGPRVLLLDRRALRFTGKFMVGEAQLDVPAGLPRGGTYFAYAPGAAIEVPLARRISARVEYEYQFWPGFKCFSCTNGGKGGLTPNGFDFGISYAIPSRSE